MKNLPWYKLPVRCIVAGGRDFSDYQLMCTKLDHLFSKKDPDDLAIISGKAKGADTLAERYTADHDLQGFFIPADWDKHGKKAGYLRNIDMAENATHCVVFWDGVSRGTKMMIEIARQYGLKLRIIRY